MFILVHKYFNFEKLYCFFYSFNMVLHFEIEIKYLGNNQN